MTALLLVGAVAAVSHTPVASLTLLDPAGPVSMVDAGQKPFHMVNPDGSESSAFGGYSPAEKLRAERAEYGDVDDSVPLAEQVKSDEEEEDQLQHLPETLEKMKADSHVIAATLEHNEQQLTATEQNIHDLMEHEKAQRIKSNDLTQLFTKAGAEMT